MTRACTRTTGVWPRRTTLRPVSPPGQWFRSLVLDLGPGGKASDVLLCGMGKSSIESRKECEHEKTVADIGNPRGAGSCCRCAGKGYRPRCCRCVPGLDCLQRKDRDDG